MYNVLLKFTFEGPEEVDEDLAGDLLSGFYQNGQLVDYFGYPITQNNTLIYNGVILQPDALDVKYYTLTAIERLKWIKEQDNISVTIDYEITGELPRSTINNLTDVSAFILYEGGASPVKSLDTFANVPLYLLPKTSFDGRNYDNIIWWVRSYEAISGTWFRGNVDEPYFYDQLTNYKSALSLAGMEICQQITSLTGIPCYYHLFNDPNPDVPDFEYCPKCNGSWKLEEEIFDTFKYKCSNCYIIS